MSHKTTKAVKQMFDALHIAEMVILADMNTRIQQPVEREANETITKVICEAIGDAKALPTARAWELVCECHKTTIGK